jgi:hypothetical protein
MLRFAPGALLVLCLGHGWRVAQAQTPDTTLAQPLPALSVQAVRARSIAPPVATKTVDSLVLRKAQASNVWDLVRRVAGVEIHEQGQGPGFASDAVIRGFTSDHSSDLLLVIDGVPVNLPLHGHVEGYADWNVLFPAAAAELRVIHGPASPLYGDFAYGGVVEVATPSSATGLSGALSGSSFGDASGWFRGGRQEERTGWLAGGRFERSQGWRENADYLVGNGLLRARTTLGAAELDTGLLFYITGWDSPGYLSVADYNAGRLRQAGDLTDGGNAGRLIAQARYTRPLTSRLGLSMLGWTQWGKSTVYLNIPEGDAFLRQTEDRDRRTAFGGQLQLTSQTGAGELSLGMSGRADQVHYRLRHTEARVVRDSLAAFDGAFRSGAVFARWRHLLGSILVDAGLRTDVQRYESTDLLADSVTRARTHTVISPKLGARYLLTGQLGLLASLSRGFRGAPGVITDPDREPQRVWAKEVAVEYFPGAASLRLAYFRLDVTGERIQDPVTRLISDAGTSVRQGLDGDATVPLGRHLRLTASGTYNHARISGASPNPVAILAWRGVEASVPPVFHLVPLEPGDPVPGVSRYLARVGLDARLTDRVTAGAVFRLNGPFTPIGEPTARTRPYTLIDVSGAWSFSGSWSLDWELQNLLSSRYPEVRASGYLAPGGPRVLRAALRHY